MRDPITAIKTALNVLSAINDRREPDRADVEELRRYVPLSSDLSPDELACMVIQRSVKLRAE